MAAAARSLGRGRADACQLGQGRRAGKLNGADSKPVSAEQMEISRLRAELARVKMERDILGKATAYFAKEPAVKYAWIERHRRVWPVSVQCQVLGSARRVPRSTSCARPAVRSAVT